MAAMDLADVAARQEDHAQDHYDVEPYEGAGAKGAILEVTAGQCARYR